MSAVLPQKVLHELAELWVTLGKQNEGEGATGVLRACAMTLVALLDEPDEAAAADEVNVAETIAHLMREHPSRAIVIRLKPAEEAVLEARVFARCWMPFGRSQQICCEQIEILASDASLGDVPGVVLPLTVADLPVILWCRSIRPFRLAAFDGFHKLADKVIVDSAGCDDVAGVLAGLAAAIADGGNVADLAWTRLTRRRDLIAQIFENPEYLSKISRISAVRIHYAGAAVPVSAYYLAAWLLDGLHRAGAQPSLHFDAQGGAGRGELLVVELTGGIEVEVGLVEGGVFEARVGDLANRTAFPDFTDQALLREELAILERDAVYEGAVAGAARLAAQ